MVTKEEKKGEKEGRTETQKTECLENEKSFLDKIKSIFHSFWRAIIWWKKKKKCEYKQLILFLSYYYHSGFELSLRTSQIAKWSLIIEFVKLQVFFPLKINSSKLYLLFYLFIAYSYQKKYCSYPKLQHKMQKMLRNSWKTFSPAAG